MDRLLLLGPPGIGKTEVIKQRAEQLASQLGRKFVDLRRLTPREFDAVMTSPGEFFIFHRLIAPHVFPEDVGVPRERGGGLVEFLPPKVLKVLSIEQISGVLFVDELTNVQRKDQLSLFFALLQEKELGWDLRLSDDVMVIAAANPPEYSSVANLLPAPLVNRLTILQVEPPTVNEWAEYMSSRYGDSWDKRTAAYLTYHPHHLFSAKTAEDTLENFPTPRAWTELALMLPKLTGKSPTYVGEYVVGRIGHEAGRQFAAFLATEFRREWLDRVAAEPRFFEELKVSQKAMLIWALAGMLSDTDAVKKYVKFLEYLGQNHREDLVIMLQMMTREARRKLIHNSAELRRVLVDTIDSLVTGL